MAKDPKIDYPDLIEEAKHCAICQKGFWRSPKAKTRETRELCLPCRRWVKEIQRTKERG
jgi:hypothetical protein